jgi:hypothetical protein
MVERATGEMVGSDRVRPIDYMRASVIDDEFFNQAQSKQLLGVQAALRSKKTLDTADIVRDGRYVVRVQWVDATLSCSLLAGV